jgi:hypothetical protein
MVPAVVKKGGFKAVSQFWSNEHDSSDQNAPNDICGYLPTWDLTSSVFLVKLWLIALRIVLVKK